LQPGLTAQGPGKSSDEVVQLFKRLLAPFSPNFLVWLHHICPA